MQSEDDSQLLKVIVISDDDGWFAQGLELDHDAEGDSLEGVKRNFERGLAGLVALHLKAHGHLRDLLRTTPVDTWEDLMAAGENFTLSYVSLQGREKLGALPFAGISYLEPATAPLAVPWARRHPEHTTHRQFSQK